APSEREIRPSRAAPEGAKHEDSGDLEVTVVEVRRLGQLADVRFVTEDGRVWRQTDGRRVRLPKPPFHAVISLGALGSHFLSPAGATVSLRVTEERP
ncbi:MAG TPA: hypothetical protein VFV10_10465, partial [Gammaproteobacteria bacterium]|nr:hypothetical protein [Gammaproteobacteria bacterium]